MTFIQDHRDARKTETSAPFTLLGSQSIWMEFGVLLRLVGEMNIVFILIPSYQ